MVKYLCKIFVEWKISKNYQRIFDRFFGFRYAMRSIEFAFWCLRFRCFKNQSCSVSTIQNYLFRNRFVINKFHYQALSLSHKISLLSRLYHDRFKLFQYLPFQSNLHELQICLKFLHHLEFRSSRNICWLMLVTYLGHLQKFGCISYS